MTDDDHPRGETGLIEAYFAPLARGYAGALKLKDDAGFLDPPPGTSVILTADAIVEGIHYLPGTNPSDIGYKALAVNISDLCAKGADPEAYLLTLALPRSCGDEFLSGLSKGLAKAQDDFSCHLLGGDTVRTDGPVVISITAAGLVPSHEMTHRSGAGEGDSIYVTGSIGDAALGLIAMQEEGGTSAIPDLDDALLSHLKARYLRPGPKIATIPFVRQFASAAMDISDGLIGDFTKLAKASGIGGYIESTKVPLSPAASAWLSADPDMIETVLTGGDDYEVLMTVPEEKCPAFEAETQKNSLKITKIGEVTSSGRQVRVQGADGEAMRFSCSSYDHF